jgi:hypothetical protein
LVHLDPEIEATIPIFEFIYLLLGGVVGCTEALVDPVEESFSESPSDPTEESHTE